ncbi:unnamed protein product [Arctia plantaginis]|uniref:Uncharacterized protein n=1 Tax=Arctia plantaginis TaxID=874455 RepID=A0A8S1AI30_ARCPL|nr:unnamed protein product [Arctia plantaginis]CAB3249296.1 unnamed protein product [Arctia plantaginis]
MKFVFCVALADCSSAKRINDFSSLHYTNIKEEGKAHPLKSLENWDSNVVIAWSEQKQPPITPANRFKGKYTVRERPPATVKWPSTSKYP